MPIIRNAYNPGDFSHTAPKRSNLHADVAAFLRKHQMKPTNFGLLVANSANLVKQIQKHKPRKATVDRIYSFIEQYEEGGA